MGRANDHGVKFPAITGRISGWLRSLPPYCTGAGVHAHLHLALHAQFPTPGLGRSNRVAGAHGKGLMVLAAFRIVAAIYRNLQKIVRTLRPLLTMHALRAAWHEILAAAF